MPTAIDAPGTQGLGIQATGESCDVRNGAQVPRRHFKKKAQCAGGDAPPSKRPFKHIHIHDQAPGEGRGCLKANWLSKCGLFFPFHLTLWPAFLSPTSPLTPKAPDEKHSISFPSCAGPGASFLFDSGICESRSLTHFDVVTDRGFNLLENSNSSLVPGGGSELVQTPVHHKDGIFLPIIL